ncbi:hypothetical protein SAMN05421862_1229 [Pseudomonas extremaustralis]|nr:hypothetical protein SAMN05421862_1229 [Pseudomonas extremaustralis]
MLAKNVNDNAALSDSPRRLCVLREQARSYTYCHSRILYQATYSAGKNSSVSKVAMMIPPIIA